MGKASAKRRARQDEETRVVWLQQLVVGPDGTLVRGKSAASRELTWTRDERGFFVVTSPCVQDPAIGPLEITSTQLPGESKRQLYRRHAHQIVTILTAAHCPVEHRSSLEVAGVLARQRATAEAMARAHVREKARRRAAGVLGRIGPGAPVETETNLADIVPPAAG